ncbi:Rv3235 family protein [Luteipulveratus flavus]|uniref:Rv3235 family protein n=1 Tax=Luteipulveratus flavus TaxID=3031728 RepID=A0ABT6C2J1_9MICO|nr:Rv3235 family protein [Luteipulveratus sp. YIM 133296]MDF8262900.1 Rv3235 family protein [Luteipulveratus sp. YIM 133296]
MTTTTLRACPRPVTLRPTAAPEPPALDEGSVRELYAVARHGLRRPRAVPSYVQGSLAIDFRARDEDPDFGPQATLRTDLPEPAVWVHRLLHATLESVTGVRQPHQLSRWMIPAVHATVVRRHRVAQRRGAAVQHTQVRRVRVDEPVDGVVEAAAVVVLDGRVRAVAMRLNGVDGRWLLTEMTIG